MKKYVFKYFLLLAVIAVTILFWRQNFMLFGILSFLSIILLWIDNFKLAREYFAVAIFGSITEILIINNSEAWDYKATGLLGVPLWLFPLWGIAGVLSVSVYLFFNKKELSKKMATKK
jgi:hypothetical protein